MNESYFSCCCCCCYYCYYYCCCCCCCCCCSSSSSLYLLIRICIGKTSGQFVSSLSLSLSLFLSLSFERLNESYFSCCCCYYYCCCCCCSTTTTTTTTLLSSSALSSLYNLSLHEYCGISPWIISISMKTDLFCELLQMLLFIVCPCHWLNQFPCIVVISLLFSLSLFEVL